MVSTLINTCKRVFIMSRLEVRLADRVSFRHVSAIAVRSMRCNVAGHMSGG